MSDEPIEYVPVKMVRSFLVAGPSWTQGSPPPPGHVSAIWDGRLPPDWSGELAPREQRK